MKVTPRLPVHGLYLQSAYVEMRYFRFGGFSLPAALLFSLSETCSHPHFQALQAKVLDEVNLMQWGERGKELMTLSVSKEASSNQIITAWNAHTSAVEEIVQFFGLGSMSLTQITEMWEGKYKLQLVKHGNEALERANLEAVYWDEGPDASIVLLYKEYGLESFEVLSCKHIYLKSALYRKAREVMQRPRVKQEMMELAVICEDITCKANLSFAVFDIAKKDAKIGINFQAEGLSLSNLSLSRAGSSHGFRCKRCKTEEYEWICVRHCTLCVSCAAIASMTKFGYSCPLCGAKYNPNILEKISQARRQIKGLPLIAEMVRCRHCQCLKPVMQFSVLANSTHACWLCDQCLLTQPIEDNISPQICPCCGDVLSLKDMTAIRDSQREQARKEEQKEERKLSCQLCYKAKTDAGYKACNHRNPTCCICDECFRTKVKPLGKCLFCSETISRGFLPPELRCLGCRTDKQPADFRLFLYMQHPCRLCNSCIFTNRKACLYCWQPFSNPDLEVIHCRAQPDLIDGKRCPCENRISGGQFTCANKCFCSACYLTNMLITRSMICPACASPCVGNLPANVQCSRCFRNIFTSGHTALAVSGICAKGHILCQHCVNVDGEYLSCPICQTVIVQGKPASELRMAQGKLFLACYCDREGESDLVETSCGHVIHWHCKSTLYFCRICEKEILHCNGGKPKEVATIWKYAK